MTHRLQAEFATSEGEENYTGALRGLVASGDLEAAEDMLMADLAALDRDLAAQCAALSRGYVKLDGWPELVDAIAQFEGDPVTGVAIGMGNDPDLVFDKGEIVAPFVTLGIYTDEGFRWSAASREEILGQCVSEEPQWAGHEEDIEVYLEIEGLEAINTALIHHKHRFFLRDGQPDTAPEGYVEYVLASWLRALRFHQAVAAEVAEHGLPGHIPVVSGTVDMPPETAAVHFPEKAVEIAAPEVELGSLIKTAAPRRGVLPDEAQPISNIRRRIAAANDQQGAGAKRGFLSRMFGR